MENNSRSFALGNDLVHVRDFEQSLNELFKKKVYTENELAYCELFADSLLRYASTWAAKEAVYKAVKQLDRSPLKWKDIEILREKIAGEPRVILHKHDNRFRISLSISHDGDYVWAAALIA
jgi:phosphopantetheine--protein transferase-like protein